MQPTASHTELAAFERALDDSDDSIPSSMIYAYAALREGVPFANAAPNLTVFVSLNGKEFAILKYGDSVTRAVSALNRAGWGTYGIAMFLGAGPMYLDVSRVR